MQQSIKESLIKLFENWSNQKVVETESLPESGSYRQYIRFIGEKDTAIGVYNADIKENKAFIRFSKHFFQQGLPVPEIYSVNESCDMYLQQDLGKTCLLDYVMHLQLGEGFATDLIDTYKKVIQQLIQFQIKGDKNLDYSVCYPRNSFDKQSMIWDLHYFKYYFLKLAKISFDEQFLEDDFQKFADYLLQAPRDYFLYRDFQSRNIMLKNGEPYFIDYQGGRKGALQYDLASLLYDAKADIPESVREELLDFYITELAQEQPVDTTEFKQFYQGYVLIRMMQAMGAFGFRGLYERKKHFLQSIPYALKNLKAVLSKINLPIELPELETALHNVVNSTFLQEVGKEKEEKLIVEVNSFSYRRGIPLDKSTNGGGFVFDCRAIHNPGRYRDYVNKTGKDADVIAFFKEKTDMPIFLQSVYQLVDMSVEKYIQRKFTNLQVNFGCTGGRHRSVYAAESLAQHLRERFDINVIIKHIEREIEG